MKYILFIYLFISLNLYSQEKSQYRVLSALDSIPIENAYVSINGFLETVTDKSGRFKIKNDFETIQISHLVFNPIVMTKFDLNEENTIYLNEKIEGLDEILIKSNKTSKILLPSEELGIGLHRKKGFRLNQNSVYVTFIPNDIGEECLISKIIVEVYGEMYQENTNKAFMPFRVNLFTINKETKLPGEKLLKESLLTSNKGRSESKMVYVDISDYLIDFPKEGIFVTVESLNLLELESFNIPAHIPSFRAIKKKNKSKYVGYQRVYTWNRLTMDKDSIYIDWIDKKMNSGILRNTYNFGIEVEY